jgi:hypothetical protein
MSKQSDNEQVMTKNPSSSTFWRTSSHQADLDTSIINLWPWSFCALFLFPFLYISLHWRYQKPNDADPAGMNLMPWHATEDVSKIQTSGSHYCHLLQPQWSPTLTHSLVMPKKQKKNTFLEFLNRWNKIQQELVPSAMITCVKVHLATWEETLFSTSRD